MSIEDSDKNVNINFRVPLAYRKALKEKAAEQGINLSKFFRNCIEREIQRTTSPAGFVPAIPLEEDRYKTMFAFRLNPTDLKNFEKFCELYHKDSGKVIRAFIHTVGMFLSEEGTQSTESLLFYLILFLQNEMKKQGYHMSLDEVSKDTCKAYPKILDCLQGKDSIIYKVFDSSSKVLYTIPFKKD